MKNRTLNEIRQSKEYQTALQGGDFIKPTNKPAKSTGEIMLKTTELIQVLQLLKN
jgi:hypothetical protein